MKIIYPGAEFVFDIYYDGITDLQWQNLLWVLTLGENQSDSKMCHKLGHGKPLGLGSVKLVVESCEERKVDAQGYHVSPKDITKIRNNFKNNEIMNSLKKVLNMNEPFVDSENQKYPIDYPDLVDANDLRIDLTQVDSNKCARHQWYRRNKDKDSRQVLPPVIKNGQVLMAYRYTEHKNFVRNVVYEAIIIKVTSTNILIKVNDKMGSIKRKNIKKSVQSLKTKYYRQDDKIKVCYVNSEPGRERGTIYHNFIPAE